MPPQIDWNGYNSRAATPLVLPRATHSLRQNSSHIPCAALNAGGRSGAAKSQSRSLANETPRAQESPLHPGRMLSPKWLKFDVWPTHRMKVVLAGGDISVSGWRVFCSCGARAGHLGPRPTQSSSDLQTHQELAQTRPIIAPLPCSAPFSPLGGEAMSSCRALTVLTTPRPVRPGCPC